MRSSRLGKLLARPIATNRAPDFHRQRPPGVDLDRPATSIPDTLSAFAMELGIVIHNVYARRPGDGQCGWGTA
jgi:hypothetical protein